MLIVHAKAGEIMEAARFDMKIYVHPQQYSADTKNRRRDRPCARSSAV
ncbi:hypothetical protein SJ05684_c19820 [Sinorhizobium sojae CCBAU 05684]|uniref:Uncharacterized protein n=1 Tax=Sinorhizobium sojae CCBAU 05684 TaxID=716928 RepID=A0A249PCM6_9HYPH|nr:hypothetical protein SJ05684_c19820 [Sinorhizobium sojae CCBAU 05684]